MSNIRLMLIGTLAIGMFLLPAVVSTFSGSHDYIAPDNVECTKCHPEVLVELSSSIDDHTHAGNATQGGEWILDCVECHTVSGVGDNPEFGHAAQKVDCAFCHDDSSFTGDGYSEWAHSPTSGDPTSGLMVKYDMYCDACHRPGEYNKPGMFLDDVYENIIDPDAAHYEFYENSVDSDVLLGASESCVGCHTHVDFNMTQADPNTGMTYDRDTGEFGVE